MSVQLTNDPLRLWPLCNWLVKMSRRILEKYQSPPLLIFFWRKDLFPRYVDRSSDNKKSFLLLYVYFLGSSLNYRVEKIHTRDMFMFNLLLKGVRSCWDFLRENKSTFFFYFWLRLYLRSREEETAQVLVENVLTKLVLTIKTIYCHSLHINTI